MTPATGTAARCAGAAAIAGGAAWLALVPASLLRRSGDLSHDGYFRLVALPLVLFAVAWALVGPLWRPGDLRARFGYGLTLAGLTLAAAGTALEFWGAWLAGEATARDEPAAGEAVWAGSDLGWSLSFFGVMVLFAGGPTAAVALRRALPLWALTLITLLGFGVFAATLFDESSPAVTLPFFGAFAAGWIGLGVLLLRAPERLAQSRHTLDTDSVRPAR